MSVSAHRRSTDEKVGVILSQVVSLRRRLNLLAVQRAIFATGAVAAAVAAAIYAGALLLGPLTFLAFAAATLSLALSALWRMLRSAWRMRASASSAAALADERAELKGRLTTIVGTVHERRHGMLWSFLVEDALGRSEEYKPGSIERRRIDRSILGFLAALAVAILVIPLAGLFRPPIGPTLATHGDITLNLNDLQVLPAGPDDSEGVQVEADAATMRRLEDKLAQQGAAASAAGGASSGMGHMLDRARSFAGRMQNKLRGASAAHRPLTLKLAATDLGPESARPRTTNPQLPGSRPDDDTAGQFQRDDRSKSGSDSLPPMGKVVHGARNRPAPTDDPNRGDLMGAGNSPAQADSTNAADLSRQSSSGQASSGGPSHGIGADPDGLFGDAINSRMGSEGFEISIQARPMEQGAKGAGEAYLPPKVSTPLNSRQRPDEPVARAAIPADDRTAIQRVFER
jgi:membrane protein implicated in regulation of membrane protease activity